MSPVRAHHRERRVDQAPDLGRVLPPPFGQRGVGQAFLDRNNVLHIREHYSVKPPPRTVGRKTSAPRHLPCQQMAGFLLHGAGFAAI